MSHPLRSQALRLLQITATPSSDRHVPETPANHIGSPSERQSELCQTSAATAINSETMANT